ncbi:hypothetical protein JRO89_XS13G0232600 [Xanthoceras sorbifolium]|uniref:Large ribosomal subunit protein uL29c n=1 Tax=Xanthoceras sorbifolium TaxID=99658 RepID=A0ABQ8H9L6_9ROSI|nr:hypothetical protein JRO89_XS13G0232600 [Xanthoceras sorbifolium]
MTAVSKDRPSSSSVVMMVKRDQELEEIRSKTIEEINEEVVDLKGKLFMLRLQISVRNEFKSSEFRRMRKRTKGVLYENLITTDFIDLMINCSRFPNRPLSAILCFINLF